MTPEQQLQHADEGERAMIDICAKKNSIKLALDEFETLRDGEPPRLTLMKRYYEITPALKNYKSFFFELAHAGQKANIGYSMIMLRFLSLCPRGQRFYEDNTDAITKDGLTELETLTLYKKFAPKLERHETANSVTVKEEPSSKFLNKPSVSQRSSTGSKKNDMTCRSCSKSGHYEADCFVKCISCGGKGHNSKVCPSKVFKKNTKRPS